MMVQLSTSVFTLLALLSPLTSSFVIPLPENLQAFLGLENARLENTGPTPDSYSLHDEGFNRPSWFTSTLMARRLLALAPSGVISTTFPDSIPPSAHAPSDVAGLSIGLREYIADCDGSLPKDLSHDDNGDPTILGLRIGTTFKNIASGSNLSLQLDWWDHLDEAGPVYPGLPLSPAALPRVTLFGYLDNLPFPLPDDAAAALEECFLGPHPDAKVWLPGASYSPHASFWARLVVTHAYWIGGFGDVQQIGWINLTEWQGIRPYGSIEGVGDGRGWQDVRLPGEKQ
ncbi:FMN-binding split barrel-like protein [Penicillium brevicompactum]|uniref:FMN-binding split barrel-like protein n=1 Tax=Penicillium brevicompactum TaxID=5074 RepID=A0A9W9QKY7_PENBR|nr:FMN-binding split barrel-like protein [Penicillium brevicompactum]